ncbi:MAG: hypothetical protein ACK2UA_14600 [Anaerolineae bacterium]|jgi:hypothetical protein
MKITWKSGRWFILTVVLLSLTGSMPSDGPARQEDAQAATLVHLAQTNLQDRLGIRAEVIALESTRPLIFPCPAADTCQERSPGYVVRLAVDKRVYEYNGRMLGQQAILWYEVELGQP